MKMELSQKDWKFGDEIKKCPLKQYLGTKYVVTNQLSSGLFEIFWDVKNVTKNKQNVPK